MSKEYEKSTGKEGMNFRDFVHLIQSYVRYFWRKSIWILSAGLLIAILFVISEWRQAITYSANLTFMVNEEDNSSIGGVGAILGQFGFGGASTSEYNLDKIVDLGRSRRITESVLLDSIEVDGKGDLISNHLINLYEYHDKWADSKNEKLHGFLFTSGHSAGFARTDNLVLGILYGLITGDPKKGERGLVSISYTDETGILNVSSNSVSEELSLELSRLIFSNLSDFYVDKSTEKQRETLRKLRIVSDSLERELSRVEYRLANFQDRSANILRQSDKVNNSKLQRDAQVLTIMYGEAIKNRETARFVLDSKTPFFQVVDDPRYPLAKSNKFYYKQAAIGVMFGAFLGVVFLGFQKAFREAMNDDQHK